MVFLLMVPTIVSGTISYGIFIQIQSAFRRIGRALQVLINSWPQLIELVAVGKRLRALDQSIYDHEASSVES